MNLQSFVIKVFELHRDDLAEVIGDLTQDEAAWRPAPAANPIGFLLWHLTRVEDGWVQRVIQREKHLWVRAGWAVRFGMPEDQRDMGFDYREDQIRDFAPPPLELLRDYFDAVRGGTLDFLASWDPGADDAEHRAPWGGTVGTADILAQLAWEMNQHAGQIAYLKGLQRGLLRPDYMGPLSLSS